MSTAALEGVPDPRTDDGWVYWLENSEYRDRDRAAGIYDPDGEYRANADFIAAHFAETCDGHWTCDAYDPEHGTCTAHEAGRRCAAATPGMAGSPQPTAALTCTSSAPTSPICPLTSAPKAPGR